MGRQEAEGRRQEAEGRRGIYFIIVILLPISIKNKFTTYIGGLYA